MQLTIISVIVMVILWMLNIYFLSQYESEKLEQEFFYVQKAFVDALMPSLQKTDVGEIQKKLNMLDTQTYVKQIAVFRQDKQIASSPEKKLFRKVTRIYPLKLSLTDKINQRSDLRLTADLSQFYLNIIKRSVVFLFTESLLVGLLIYSVYRLMDKKLFVYLNEMAHSMKAVDHKTINQQLVLNRKNHTGHDELDALVSAFNKQRTELITTHQALMFSQDKFFKIFDSSPDAILITSFDTGIILDVNKSFYRLYEFDIGDEVVGKTSQELGLWAETENREEWKKHIKKQGPIYLRESKYRKKSGKTSDSVASMQVIDFGDILSLVTTIRDISQTKRYEEQLLHSQKRLQNLAKSQQEIRENERIGIAREIHDELGQSFTGLKFDLYSLQAYFDERDVLKDQVNKMIQNIDASVDTVRRISSELRPSVLDDLGLEAAIEWFTNDFTSRTGIRHQLTIDCEDLSLVQHRDTAIFRIYQETLTNIARHSKANHFSVEMQLIEYNIILRVKDNGVGITKQELNADNSIGIIGMQERAANIGATLKIIAQASGGTEVELTCPLGKQEGLQ